MMRRLVPLFLASLLAACASQQQPAVGPAPTMTSVTATPPAPTAPSVPPAEASKFVELENPATGVKIKLLAGGELKLLLDADPAVGYQWFGPKDVGPLLSPIGERIHVTKSATAFYLGEGGWNIFRFRAEQPGNKSFTFEYRRPWDTAPYKTLRMDVSVE